MAAEIRAGDPYVLNVQKWVNNKFRGKAGYTEVSESGYTGWPTIYALLHGLQITLEVGSTANNFGPGTESAWNTFVRQNGTILERTPEQDEKQREKLDSLTGDDKVALEKYLEQLENIHGIIQGALLCKGYSIGTNTPTGNFYSGTGNAIKKLKRDAGLSDSNTVVTLNLIKALLSMDYFFSYNTSEKTQKIIEMQRYLNGNYEDYIGLRPCDGVYGRSTNTALIYAIQAEENMPTSVANGNCGPSTKRCLPTLSVNGTSSGTGYTGQAYSNDSLNRFKILANMAMYFNGFGTGELTSNLDASAIKSFQDKYSIAETGIVDYTTWLSLLVSCGDTDRTAIACDCATIITKDNIEVLKNNNYKYIGRYLSGTAGSGENQFNKGLSTEELQLLFNNGIRVFPIHQGAANYVAYFTEEKALEDARIAVENADNLHLQFGAIIYFAVDCDATDEQITYTILPYFKVLYAEVMIQSRGKYRVGIYGTRNVCSRISKEGFACSSFVSDMSTGFSGNLGFTIPDNWALDQFATVKITSGSKSIEIDKDGFSGNYLGISQEYSVAESGYAQNTTTTNSFVLVNRSGSPIPVYESKKHINWPLPQSGTQYGVDGKIIGYIKPDEFYIFFGVEDPSYDNIHCVLFNDGTDVRKGYIEGRPEYANINGEHNMNQANYDQKPLYQEPYSCFRYLPETNEYELKPSTENQEITINKPVVFFNAYGNYEGMLNKGDKIIISSNNVNNTGASRPWCYRAKVIKNGDTLSGDKYVSVGLEYASSGKERAWY